MKIYTSYFGNAKKLPSNLVKISICLSPPRGYYGLEYRRLAPTFKILQEWKRCPIEENYIQDYYNLVLNKLDRDTVCHQLESMSEGADVVLLCYERPEDFCHRHLVAEWLNAKGYDVKEWQNEG